MKRTLFFGAISLIVFLGIISSFWGCSRSTSTTGYVTESLTKRGISYSFEYPASYQVDLADTALSNDSSPFIGSEYVTLNEETREHKDIKILLWNPSTDYPDAKAKADYYEGIINSLNKLGNRVIYNNRSPVQVDGIGGEMLEFSYKLGDTNATDTSKDVAGWMVFLDHNGQTFHITLICSATLADGAKSDFEHLIKSFKFLN